MRAFITRGGAISVAHLAELHRAADDLAGAPAEGVGGDCAGPACQAHAGAGTALGVAAEAAGAASAVGGYTDRVEGEKPAHGAPTALRDAMRSGLRAHIVMDDATADALMLAARVHVHSLWDGAVALAAEDGPVSLAVGEPWAEGDEAYRERLIDKHDTGIGYTSEWVVRSSGKTLDRDGACLGVDASFALPRARLVSANA